MIDKILGTLWTYCWRTRAWSEGVGKNPHAGVDDTINGREMGPGDDPNAPPEYKGPRRDRSKGTQYVVIGDSSGNHLAQRLMLHAPVHNYARNGASTDYFMDKDIVKKPGCAYIMMIGGNNVGLQGEDAPTVVKKHRLLYNKIAGATVNPVLVIGLSPVTGTEGFGPEKNADICFINDMLKSIYGPLFIDTFPRGTDMMPCLTDGVHHAYGYDLQIIRDVMERLLMVEPPRQK